MTIITSAGGAALSCSLLADEDVLHPVDVGKKSWLEDNLTSCKKWTGSAVFLLCLLFVFG